MSLQLRAFVCTCACSRMDFVYMIDIIYIYNYNQIIFKMHAFMDIDPPDIDAWMRAFTIDIDLNVNSSSIFGKINGGSLANKRTAAIQ